MISILGELGPGSTPQCSVGSVTLVEAQKEVHPWLSRERIGHFSCGSGARLGPMGRITGVAR